MIRYRVAAARLSCRFSDYKHFYGRICVPVTLDPKLFFQPKIGSGRKITKYTRVRATEHTDRYATITTYLDGTHEQGRCNSLVNLHKLAKALKPGSKLQAFRDNKLIVEYSVSNNGTVYCWKVPQTKEK
jgi:hypothetical protein